MAIPRSRNRPDADPMPAVARIGQILTVRRLALGLTQQALADLAGTSRSTVQALERGTGTVKLSLFIDVAEVLGLRIDATTASA